MSHAATNWAIRQRGLKPAAKIVLWNLADRHNADSGRCDPDQALLAADCEMSRSTLNLHLAELERRGLILRVQRIDEQTKRQQSTFYRLSFDSDLSVSENRTRTQDVVGAVSENRTRAVSENRTQAVSEKQPEPCPKNGESRVRNSDTNPVREPGKNHNAHPRVTRFEEFWQAYPHRHGAKKGKQPASVKYAAAVKLGTPEETIIAGAKAAHRHPDVVRGFSRDPTTWINQAGWLDEIGPAPDARLKRWEKAAREYEEPAA